MFGIFEGKKVPQPRRQTLDSRNESDNIFFRYLDLLRAAAATIFEYHNLPKTVNPLYLENVFLDHGSAAVFVPKGTDILLGGSWVPRSGKWTVYGFPKQIDGLTASPRDHILKVRTREFVIGYDSVLAYRGTGGYSNTLQIINNFARLLWEVENTFRSNLMHQNKPFIIDSTTNTRLSLANFWNMFQDFAPYIMAEKKGGIDLENDIKTVDLKVPFLGNDILDAREKIWGMAMNALGYGPGTTKKERQLTDEVIINRMADAAQLNARFAPREDFCRRINERFKGRVIGGEVFHGDCFVTVRGDPVTMQEVAAIVDEQNEIERSEPNEQERV